MSGQKRTEMVWRAFSVEPQKERVAQTILTRNGYQAEVPVEIRMRRATRYDKRKVAVRYPMLVGYVFVRLPSDYPWGMLFDYRLVRSIVGFAGQPAAIPDDSMQRLLHMSGASLPSRVSTGRRSFAAGDVVEIAEGAFQGWTGKVEDIKGNKARMVFQMLGAQRELDIPLEQLHAA